MRESTGVLSIEQDRAKRTIYGAGVKGTFVANIVFRFREYSAIKGAYGASIAQEVCAEVSLRVKKNLSEQDQFLDAYEVSYCSKSGTINICFFCDCSDWVDVFFEDMKRRIECLPVNTLMGNVYFSLSVGKSFTRVFGACHLSQKDFMNLMSRAEYSSQTKSEELIFDEKPLSWVVDAHKLLEASELGFDQGDLALVFQDVSSLSTGKVEYSECLLRSLEGGVPFSVFQQIAGLEKLNLIAHLDLKILTRVLEILRNNLDVTLACNVSRQSISDQNWVNHVTKLLKENEQLCGRVVIEITESCQISNFDTAIKFVQTAKKFGCKIALDDFGVGYTTIENFVTFDFDYVKIDKSFISGCFSDKLELAECISSVGWSMGAKVVAEGVETQEQLEFCKALGVEFVQGTFLSMPKFGLCV